MQQLISSAEDCGLHPPPSVIVGSGNVSHVVIRHFVTIILILVRELVSWYFVDV